MSVASRKFPFRKDARKCDPPIALSTGRVALARDLLAETALGGVAFSRAMALGMWRKTFRTSIAPLPEVRLPAAPLDGVGRRRMQCRRKAPPFSAPALLYWPGMEEKTATSLA